MILSHLPQRKPGDMISKKMVTLTRESLDSYDCAVVAAGLGLLYPRLDKQQLKKWLIP
jgi:hypothetical protein